jgi:hypothetical protein
LKTETVKPSPKVSPKPVAEPAKLTPVEKKVEPAKVIKTKPHATKNKNNNHEDPSTGMVFERIDGKVKVIGSQDKTSSEKGRDSVLPLSDELIQFCIKNSWPYDATIIKPKEEETLELDEEEEDTETYIEEEQD